MGLIGIIAASLFIFGYLLITLEQRFGLHKSSIALIMGGTLWILAAVKLSGDHDHLSESISHIGAEVFGVVAFLLAAMALIEILVHYRLFDLIRSKLSKLNVDTRQQFLMVMGLTFVFSAALDNIAITIAMLQIARRFFSGKNLLIAVAGIVVAANAGGAWSPIGDITTILLWVADKFTATEVIKYAFLPALALAAVVTAMLYPKVENVSEKQQTEKIEPLSLSEKLVVSTALISFSFPLLMSLVGLPPYVGLLFGLGLTWAMIELAKTKSRQEHQTHMTANIEKLIQTVDISSVKYIMGILLAVGALSAIGVLAWLSTTVIGESPSDAYLIAINVGMGIMSGIVDNASLVALAIPTLPVEDPLMWSLTAIMAGNGGSLMIIGSAAGIVAMGNCKQLTIGKYLKIATLPVALGMVAALAVWLIQFQFLR